MLKQVLPPHGDVLSLVKPQFEAGRNLVGKKGVVRDPYLARSVLFDVFDAAESNGFHVLHLTYSPITGGEGNIEFLVHWVKQDEAPKLSDDDLRQLVEATVYRAHKSLILIPGRTRPRSWKKYCSVVQKKSTLTYSHGPLWSVNGSLASQRKGMVRPRQIHSEGFGGIVASKVTEREDFAVLRRMVIVG